MQRFSCRDGGIGRRSGFKIRRRKVCGFESHSRHQNEKQALSAFFA